MSDTSTGVLGSEHSAEDASNATIMVANPADPNATSPESPSKSPSFNSGKNSPLKKLSSFFGSPASPTKSLSVHAEPTSPTTLAKSPSVHESHSPVSPTLASAEVKSPVSKTDGFFGAPVVPIPESPSSATEINESIMESPSIPVTDAPAPIDAQEPSPTISSSNMLKSPGIVPAPLERSPSKGPIKAKTAITEAVRATNPILEELLFAIQQITLDTPSVTSIDFRDLKNGFFTVAHGTAIATALETNTHLESLVLENCQVSNGTAVELVRAIARNPNSGLKILNLDGNQIQPAGMKAIAEMLSVNKSLTELKISRQKFPTGTDAEQSFAMALSKNQTLLKLGLQIRDPSSREKCDRAITRNKDSARKSRNEEAGK